MSQVCPSSSHQLVAAAVAFRRARRKFPKDFGAHTNAQSSHLAQSLMTKDEKNQDTESIACSSKSPDEISGDFQDDKSVKENLSDSPMTCRYCQRPVEFGDDVPVKDAQAETQNAIDMIPCRDSNVFHPQQLEDHRRCESAKPSSSLTEKKNDSSQFDNFDSHHCSYNRRLPSNLLPKMKSAGVLCDTCYSETKKKMCGCKERVCQLARRSSKGWHQQMHQTRSDPCACEYSSTRTIDLLRPFVDDVRRCRQEYRRYPDCCHHHCFHRYNAEDCCDSRTKHISCSKRNYLCTSNACTKENAYIPLENGTRECDGTFGFLDHRDLLLHGEKNYYPEEILSSQSQYRRKCGNDVCSCGVGSMRLTEKTCCTECDQNYGQGDFRKLKYSNSHLKKQGIYGSAKNAFLRNTM